MTFFEQELRGIVGSVCPDARYIGRAAFVPLGGDNVARFEFVTQGEAGRYTALRAQTVSKTNGVLDITAIRFGDIFSEKKWSPYAWIDNGKAEWYGFTPTRQDYAALTDAVRGYTELFRQTQSMAQGGPQQEMTM